MNNKISLIFGFLLIFLSGIPVIGQLVQPPSVVKIVIQVNNRGGGTIQVETRQISTIGTLGKLNSRNPQNCATSGSAGVIPKDWNLQANHYEADERRTCVTFVSTIFKDLQTLNTQLQSFRIGAAAYKNDVFVIAAYEQMSAEVDSSKVKYILSISVPSLIKFTPFDGVQTGNSVTWTHNTAGSDIFRLSGSLSYKPDDKSNGANSVDEIKKIAKDRVPKEWGEGKPSQDGKGWRWENPNNPKADSIRVMEGNPDSKYPHMREDYVQIRRDGNAIGRNGKPIEGGQNIKTGDAPEAHIPFKEWVQWSSPLKP